MAILKLLSAALFAAAVVAAPAMARERHMTTPYGASDAYAGDRSDTAYTGAPYAGYRGFGYRCVPAPRVGSFAGQPWTNDVPCEPSIGAAY